MDKWDKWIENAHCDDCRALIIDEREAANSLPNDRWEGLTFIHYEKRFGKPTELELQPMPENTVPDKGHNTPHISPEQQQPLLQPPDIDIYVSVLGVTDVVTKKMLMALPKFTTRAVAEILTKQGSPTSHMTVARRLKGQGVLL